MPPRAILTKLPSKVRAELDAKLRSAGYGDCVAIAEWLTAAGYPIRKSAVAVCSLSLKVRDRAGPGGLSPRDLLIFKLGSNRLREAQILDELKALEALDE
jgi:hypothetical protein